MNKRFDPRFAAHLRTFSYCNGTPALFEPLPKSR